MYHFINKNRKSIRLKNYDYSQPAFYFITVCTKNREHYFGNIVNSNVILSEIGRTAHKFWSAIPSHFAHTKLYAFVIMPNHIHGIIEIFTVGTHDERTPNARMGHCALIHSDSPKGASSQGSSTPFVYRYNEFHHKHNPQNKFGPLQCGSISVIINQFKSSVKRWCNQNGFAYFQWQSRFYDHIIRNNNEYSRIQNYIKNNPKKWRDDDYYCI